MSILAEALSLQLDKKEIKHSVHGDDKEGVIMMQQLPETKITTTVLFLTEDKTNSVSVCAFRLILKGAFSNNLVQRFAQRFFS